MLLIYSTIPICFSLSNCRPACMREQFLKFIWPVLEQDIIFTRSIQFYHFFSSCPSSKLVTKQNTQDYRSKKQKWHILCSNPGIFFCEYILKAFFPLNPFLLKYTGLACWTLAVHPTCIFLLLLWPYSSITFLSPSTV